MKQLFTLLIISAGMTASAQTIKNTSKKDATVTLKPGAEIGLSTPETKPTPPQYKKVVVIPIEDWQMISGALEAAKLAPLSDPQLTNDQKVQQYQMIGQYLRELPKRLKLDSVKVEK